VVEGIYHSKGNNPHDHWLTASKNCETERSRKNYHHDR
jgi:hypothetical protein